MNWLDDLINDTKQHLPFDLSNETVGKIQSYYDRFKEKTDELKHSFDQMRDFGLQTQDAGLKPTEHSSAGGGNTMAQEVAAVKPSAKTQQAYAAPYSASSTVKQKEAGGVLVKYKVTLQRGEGELSLPDGATQDEIHQAVLRSSGCTIKTKVLDRNAQMQQASALKGFNSYASLFSKF